MTTNENTEMRTVRYHGPKGMGFYDSQGSRYVQFEPEEVRAVEASLAEDLVTKTDHFEYVNPSSKSDETTPKKGAKGR